MYKIKYLVVTSRYAAGLKRVFYTVTGDIQCLFISQYIMKIKSEKGRSITFYLLCFRYVYRFFNLSQVFYFLFSLRRLDQTK